MSRLEQLVRTYERVVNEADQNAQEDAAREALADGFTFVGPSVGEVTGRAAMVETMREMRERAPADDIQLRRCTPIEEHNSWLRFGWEFVDGNGEVIARGLDVAQVAEDGKLARVIAFFDDQPARERSSREQ